MNKYNPGDIVFYWVNNTELKEGIIYSFAASKDIWIKETATGNISRVLLTHIFNTTPPAPSTPRNPNPYIEDEDEWATEDTELFIDTDTEGDWYCEIPVPPVLKKECHHKWKEYIGLLDTFEYCDFCGIKRADFNKERWKA